MEPTSNDIELATEGFDHKAQELVATFVNGNRKDVREYLSGCRPLFACVLLARMQALASKETANGFVSVLMRFASDEAFDIRRDIRLAQKDAKP